MSRIRAFQVRDSSGEGSDQEGVPWSRPHLCSEKLLVSVSNVSRTEFRPGDFVKPKEKVYQVIQDFGDGTFTAADLQTGDVSHFVSELFEKSSPPNPSPGEVWVHQEPFGGSGEGDAYLVYGYDDGEILLKGSEELLRVDPRVLYESDEWRRIH